MYIYSTFMDYISFLRLLQVIPLYLFPPRLKVLLFTHISQTVTFPDPFKVLPGKRSLLTPESCSYAARQQVSDCCVNSSLKVSQNIGLSHKT